MALYSATYDNLANIDEQVRQVAIDAGLSEKDVYDVELAVDEACTNIIDHSYGGEGLGDIEVVCEIIDPGLKIIIIDSGCFFNPDAIPLPDVKKPMKLRPEGGLGLFFMRNLMDEVHFDPCRDNGTTLTMVKYKKIIK